MESYENNFKKIYESTERQRKLDAAKREVESMIDKLGLGVDEGIKEAVAVLRAMDFPTSSSCAGHLEKDEHSPPWIEIYAKSPEGWKEDKAKQELWREENLKLSNRLMMLLNEFYKNRKVATDAQLHLANIGMLEGFRLETVGTHMKTEALGIKTQEDIFNKIVLYQKEMKAFTDFMREKFLNQ